VNRLTLGLDGTETYDVLGERTPRATLTLVIHRRNGERVEVPVTCRLDTAEEVSIYEAGGVLQRFAQDFLASTKVAKAGPTFRAAGRVATRVERIILENPHAHTPQIKIPATYMRGGTSKGVFFRLQDLPEAAQRSRRGARQAAAARDRQPRPLRQADRRHGRRHLQHQQDRDRLKSTRPATTSTTCSARSRSTSPSSTGAATAATCRRRSAVRHRAAWSTASASRKTAWSPCASGRRTSARPSSPTCPVTNGEVQETGDFELDGVTFPAAEVQLEFMDPAAEEEGAGGGAMFPTGNLVDELEVPGLGTFKATMINAGIPTIFVNAEDVGYTGAELQDAINGDPRALAMFETIRAHGACAWA
jgi:hypothetical protein